MRTLAILLLVLALPSGTSVGATADGTALIPSALAFWDAQHGLLGGNAGGCGPDASCPGSIWSTADGGLTSKILLRTSGPVESLSVARGGAAWAVVDRCSHEQCVAAELLASSDWGGTWTRLPRVVLCRCLARLRRLGPVLRGLVLGSKAARF